MTKKYQSLSWIIVVSTVFYAVVILRLIGVINTSWIVILAPWWIASMLAVAFINACVFILFLVDRVNAKNEQHIRQKHIDMADKRGWN